MKPEFATHTIVFNPEFRYVKHHAEIQPKHGTLSFSVDGGYDLFHRKISNATLVFDFSFVKEITKPVIYLYPHPYRIEQDDFYAYSINLFWETELLTTRPVSIYKSKCQILYKARSPIPSLKQCTNEFKGTELNKEILYWFHIQDATWTGSGESYKIAFIRTKLGEFINQYNETICKEYDLDYEHCKYLAWNKIDKQLGKGASEIFKKQALELGWNKSLFYYENEMLF